MCSDIYIYSPGSCLVDTVADYPRPGAIGCNTVTRMLVSRLIATSRVLIWNMVGHISQMSQKRQYALKLNMNSLLRGCLKHCGIFCVFHSLVVACPTRCGGLGLTKYGISATRVVCTVNKGAFCVAFGTSIVLTTAGTNVSRDLRASWLFLTKVAETKCSRGTHPHHPSAFS
jgi:hypothetical protein